MMKIIAKEVKIHQLVMVMNHLLKNSSNFASFKFWKVGSIHLRFHSRLCKTYHQLALIKKGNQKLEIVPKSKTILFFGKNSYYRQFEMTFKSWSLIYLCLKKSISLIKGIKTLTFSSVLFSFFNFRIDIKAYYQKFRMDYNVNLYLFKYFIKHKIF